MMSSYKEKCSVLQILCVKLLVFGLIFSYLKNPALAGEEILRV